MTEMLGRENHGLATWHDVLAYHGQGRIESIPLFQHGEKQILR
jgi:hypothetical protein